MMVSAMTIHDFTFKKPPDWSFLLRDTVSQLSPPQVAGKKTKRYIGSQLG